MRNKSLKLALAASAVLTLAACSASPGAVLAAAQEP